MTTTTVHRIDIGDLGTLRLRCEHCATVAVIDITTWEPKQRDGQVVCPQCDTSWGDAGGVVVGLVHALWPVQVQARIGRGPAVGSQVPPTPGVTAQFELADE